MQQKLSHRLVTATLIIILFILAFAFQGARGIFAPDEGYYVGMAKVMLDSGDWLVPRLNQEPWLDKPPLSLWGITVGLHLFGQNEWGARFFHGLCYILTTLLVVAIGRQLWSKRAGTLAGVVYATMAIPFAAANVATPDTPLVLWTTLAFYCFWMSIRPDARWAVFWKLAMCAVFGIGFLTKGPAALIPSGGMFVFLLLQRRALKYFLTPWALVGMVLFAAFGLTWYGWISREVPGALGYFWDNQVWGRTLSAKYSRNPGLVGALMYLPVILGGTLPWSYFWFRSLWKNRGEWSQKAWRKQLVNDPARLFLATWIAVPLLILCLASSKLPLYALPIFPALSLMTARLVPLPETRKENGSVLSGWSPRWLGALGGWVVLLVVLKAIGGHYPSRQDMRALSREMEGYLPPQPVEIVGVDDHIEGVTFYHDALSEQVTMKKNPYPFFVPPEHFREELEEMYVTGYNHVLVCRRERRAVEVRSKLNKIGWAYQEVSLPYKRKLFICKAAPATLEVVRLAVIGDEGKGDGDSRQYALTGTLYRYQEDKGIRDGILTVGDNFYPERSDEGHLENVVRRQFEDPYKPLLDLGLPFYAALGNHDLKYGMLDFELNYPHFNMQGRRYYSKVFGDNLVEVFFLDSNQMVGDKSDPEQIDWFKEALEKSQAQWKVVALHHPLYSTVVCNRPNGQMIANLEPLFIKHHVSLVLQGHNHIYERLKPIHGVQYITAGSSGKVRPDDHDPQSNLLAVGNNVEEVFVVLEFTAQNCLITAIDSSGAEIDHATLPLSL